MKAMLTEGFHALRVSPAQVLLHLTISNKCGQSFRWRERRFPVDSVKAGGSQDSCQVAPAALISEWAFCLPDRVVLLRQDAQADLILHKTLVPGSRPPTSDEVDSTERWLRDYLNLDVSLENLYQEWSQRDAVFAELAGRFGGIRMLRQDPWECLVS
jgi:N-glycosylase/DNA lyase